MQANVLMRGHKIVILKKLRLQILKELRERHFGIVKIKSLASYYWWPGIDKELDTLVKNCRNYNHVSTQ